MQPTYCTVGLCKSQAFSSLSRNQGDRVSYNVRDLWVPGHLESCKAFLLNIC